MNIRYTCVSRNFDFVESTLFDYKKNFDGYDRNGNEMLDTEDELLSSLDDLLYTDKFETVSDKEVIDDMLANSDADSDGKLTYPEWFGSVTGGNKTSLTGNVASEDQDLMLHLLLVSTTTITTPNEQSCFEKCDTNAFCVNGLCQVSIA